LVRLAGLPWQVGALWCAFELSFAGINETAWTRMISALRRVAEAEHGGQHGFLTFFIRNVVSALVDEYEQLETQKETLDARDASQA
jgi:hypothetical protein